MIITCTSCNKKFNIDESLIPDDGRLLKCGNCENTWFYKPNIEDSANLVEEKNNPEIIINETLPEKNSEEKSIQKYNKKKNINQNVETDIFKKFLNNTLIILITFIAIILIVDTFKQSISTFLPGIIPLLDNLFATLFDLKLFIKDFFN
tara:strand:+ start:94 stop:540 length:447 start_codon:yes stop_codon:yes gene_type:complete